jgi:hypothetical protein
VLVVLVNGQKIENWYNTFERAYGVCYPVAVEMFVDTIFITELIYNFDGNMAELGVLRIHNPAGLFMG